MWLVSESPAEMWGFFKPIIMKREKTGGLIDTGYMSHLDIPLPLKNKSLKEVWAYLPKDDDIPKQRLRHESAKKKNKKKLKHIKSHQKQKHESKRTKQLLKKRVKDN